MDNSPQPNSSQLPVVNQPKTAEQNPEPAKLEVVGTTVPIVSEEPETVKPLEELIVGKLIVSFQRGLSVSSACVNAGIHRDTYYDHFKKEPGFSDKMQRAKEWGAQLAGDIVVDVLLDSGRIRDEVDASGKVIKKADPKYPDKVRVDTAKWWLEKKQPEEFGRGLPVQPNGGTINNNQTNYYFLTDAEFRTKVTEQGGIADLSVEDITEALENEDLGRVDSEAPSLAVPQEALRGRDPQG